MPSDWNVDLAPYVVRRSDGGGPLPCFTTKEDAIAYAKRQGPTAYVTCFSEHVWPERDDSTERTDEYRP